MIRKELISFLDSLRDYEHESGHSIHEDERASGEFVDIYLREIGGDGILSNAENCSMGDEVEDMKGQQDGGGLFFCHLFSEHGIYYDHCTLEKGDLCADCQDVKRKEECEWWKLYKIENKLENSVMRARYCDKNPR